VRTCRTRSASQIRPPCAPCAHSACRSSGLTSTSPRHHDHPLIAAAPHRSTGPGPVKIGGALLSFLVHEGLPLHLHHAPPTSLVARTGGPGCGRTTHRVILLRSPALSWRRPGTQTTWGWGHRQTNGRVRLFTYDETDAFSRANPPASGDGRTRSSRPSIVAVLQELITSSARVESRGSSSAEAEPSAPPSRPRD
jgi:hypothetical protein